MSYTLTVGLEIHAELATKTKMFCSCENSPSHDIPPNTRVCPVCMGHPGALPTINREAVEHVLRVGAAIGGDIADHTRFDRKHYFYPDIPKGYQISQYQLPLISGGSINGVAVTRIHLEEDTARSSHAEEGSLIDYNRSSVPLMELVTEPVISSAEQAGMFGRELQRLLRVLGASDAHMERGQMRVEANISVSKTNEFGTKVEVKNLNSFRSVERAIQYEFERQTKLLEEGGVVVQETRGWNENTLTTFSQRSKENADDYRYFPEPDLPEILTSTVPGWTLERLKSGLPELPWEHRARLVSIFKINSAQADQILDNTKLAQYIDRCLELGEDFAVKAFNYITSDLVGHVEKLGDVAYVNASPEFLFELMGLLGEGTLSTRGVKTLLAARVEGHSGSAAELVERMGLRQIVDPAELEKVVMPVLEAWPTQVAEYVGGKEAVMQFLVGQVMKASGGAAGPALITDVIKSCINKKSI
jgi:aspartyl-tRNA(Asn)/glutamyl-tRNA(Gln) amidotransferase subunit B